MSGPQKEMKEAVKRGTWTPEEDMKLIAYINRYGIWNWSHMPKHAGLSRSGKSCRLRWMNYLRPDVKRGNFTKEEDDTIIKMHRSLGTRWSVIAARFPGRTDNEIKNRWHTHLKKRSDRGLSYLWQISDQSQNSSETCVCFSNEEMIEANNIVPLTNTMECVQTDQQVPTTSTEAEESIGLMQKITEVNDIGWSETFEDLHTSFWNEPFLTEDSTLATYVCPRDLCQEHVNEYWSHFLSIHDEIYDP